MVSITTKPHSVVWNTTVCVFEWLEQPLKPVWMVRATQASDEVTDWEADKPVVRLLTKVGEVLIRGILASSSIIERISEAFRYLLEYCFVSRLRVIVQCGNIFRLLVEIA